MITSVLALVFQKSATPRARLGARLRSLMSPVFFLWWGGEGIWALTEFGVKPTETNGTFSLGRM